MSGTSKKIILFACLACILFPNTGRSQDIQIESALKAQRSAPGETLPLRVRLLNFGDQSRTDVSVTFRIVNAQGAVVTMEEETVAIETSMSFIHNVALPHDIPAGTYTARIDVIHMGQQAPAQSSYQFRVEHKIAGMFVSDTLNFLLILLLGMVVAVLVFRYFHRTQSTSHFNYSDTPSDKRIYHEIIGEIIHEMRLHDGDKVLSLVQKIPGLKVGVNGHVEEIPENPTTAVATLVKEYERRFGKHANFALGTRTQRRLIKNPPIKQA